ncbi:MAG TPA: hypothetical protein VNT26_13290 [Candidatus Sulfotelmatobacter sp.]|nr:hypothetical protein [Candidatus Sulfotelmatobacter sp.]
MSTPNPAVNPLPPVAPPSDPPQPTAPKLPFELLPPPATSPPGPTGSQIGPPAPQLPLPARKVSRNGKIARLPKLERDMVNRMLFNHLPYHKIVDALDEVGIRVTERNVSNWKTRGGYKEWCLEQDRAIQVRLLQDNLTDYLRKTDASQVPEVGLQLAATYLSDFLLQPEARQQLATDPDKFARLVAMLCRLTGRIQNLQKYRDESAKELGLRHNPEHIKREAEEDIENVREVYSSQNGESAQDPRIPHRNYLPKIS